MGAGPFRGPPLSRGCHRSSTSTDSLSNGPGNRRGLVYRSFALDLAYQYRWGLSIDTGNLIATTTAEIDQHTVYTSLILHF